MNVNVKAVFNVTQALLPNFNNGSSIVNLSSLAGLRALANHAIYSASKAAVDAVCMKSSSSGMYLKKKHCNVGIIMKMNQDFFYFNLLILFQSL